MDVVDSLELGSDFGGKASGEGLGDSGEDICCGCDC